VPAGASAFARTVVTGNAGSRTVHTTWMPRSSTIPLRSSRSRAK